MKRPYIIQNKHDLYNQTLEQFHLSDHRLMSPLYIIHMNQHQTFVNSSLSTVNLSVYHHILLINNSISHLWPQYPDPIDKRSMLEQTPCLALHMQYFLPRLTSCCEVWEIQQQSKQHPCRCHHLIKSAWTEKQNIN